MAGTSTLWRQLRTALAALVLTVLTFGPSLDALICHDEGPLSAAAAEMPSLSGDADQAPADHSGEGAGVCVHGHCHHAAPYVPAALPAAETPLVTASPHALMRVAVPTSDLKFGLKRPPRA